MFGHSRTLRDGKLIIITLSSWPTNCQQSKRNLKVFSPNATTLIEIQTVNIIHSIYILNWKSFVVVVVCILIKAAETIFPWIEFIIFSQNPKKTLFINLLSFYPIQLRCTSTNTHNFFFKYPLATIKSKFQSSWQTISSGFLWILWCDQKFSWKIKILIKTTHKMDEVLYFTNHEYIFTPMWWGWRSFVD